MADKARLASSTKLGRSRKGEVDDAVRVTEFSFPKHEVAVGRSPFYGNM